MVAITAGMTGDTTTGTATGLASLLERLRPELLRFLAARCGNADEAQDVMQDLWLKLSTGAPGPVANGRAYLYRMASNLVLDRRRAQQRAMARDRHWIDDGGDGAGTVLDRADPAQPADEAMIEREEAQVLRDAVAALPPGARRALQLYRFEGRKQDEIAAEMGISRSGVEKHLALAMRQLRNTLSDCGFFGSVTSQVQDQPRGGETRQEHGQ